MKGKSLIRDLNLDFGDPASRRPRLTAGARGFKQISYFTDTAPKQKAVRRV